MDKIQTPNVTNKLFLNYFFKHAQCKVQIEIKFNNIAVIHHFSIYIWHDKPPQ